MTLASSKLVHKTRLGQVVLGDALAVLGERVETASVDLIMTSPPFGLVRKKDYGNVDAPDYLDWFRPFAQEFRRVLRDTGSLVVDIGGAWNPGQPTRSLYNYKLLIMLCEEFGFYLAQDFFWWNPSHLPTPAEWVTVRRIRVKDAVNCVWWLSPTPWPKSSNKRVLQPYSESMNDLLREGYQAKKRPSGHDISEKFSVDNGAAIPPNLLAMANTESNSSYLRYCLQQGIAPHPARFPTAVPEFFVRMLTDENDFVVDPFAGSCATGEASERLQRRWLCCDLVESYLKGAVGRFGPPLDGSKRGNFDPPAKPRYYQVARLGSLWNGVEEEPLPRDGGKKRKVAAHVIKEGE